MSTPKTWRTVEVMTQEKYLSNENLIKALDHRAIKDYAYIKHDKDTDKDGSLKISHWHIMLRFSYPVPTESICEWFCITSNFLNRIKGRFADALSYLTHKNAPDKHQYNDDEVISNFDFKKEIEIEKNKKIDEIRKQEIITGIVNGEIREYNYTEFISAFEYVKLKKIIEDSFKYRRDTLMMDKNRNLTCLFFSGDSGTGKTTYAKYFCEQKNLSYYVSSGSNDPLDGYKGEDVLILDDIRGENHNVSDVLKLLDNNTSSTVKSRYSNKFLECKYIIITSVQTPFQFFNNLYSLSNETIVQLKRRCTIYASFEYNIIYWYYYDDIAKDYILENTSDNIVSFKYRKKTARENLNNILSDVVNFSKDLPFD